MIDSYFENVRWEHVKNTSGEVCPPFGLLAVTGSEMRGVTDKYPVLLGAKPSTTFYQEYVVNGPTAIPAGGYGRATRGPGAIWIKYDTGTPANGEGWGPKPGQWTASKGFPGAVCEGIQSTSKTRMLGTLAPITVLLGKTTGAITANSASTSYQIWTGTLGSEANSGFTTVPSALSRVDIDSGKFVKLTWHNNGWLMEPLECNA